MSTRIAILCAALAAGCSVSDDPGAGDTDTDGSGTSGSRTASSGQETAQTWDSSAGGSADSTPWNIDTEDPPATSAPATTGPDTGAPETEGEGESEGEEEDFVGWFGFGTVVPGVSYSAQGEVVVYIDGSDDCILIWNAEGTPDASCEACDGAFSLTIQGVKVESDEDCSPAGTDADTLVGTTLGVGWSGKALYVDFGDGWVSSEGGEAEYVDERGEFFWELPLGE